MLSDGERHWLGALDSLQWCGALGAALEQVQVTAVVGRKLKAICDTTLGMRSFPPTDKNCKQPQHLREEAVSLRDGLKDLNVGEAIQKFLVALGRGEAVLALVDSEVLVWAKHHGIADRLRVVFRSGTP